MRTPSAPRLEERRAAEFAAELQERARAWMPQWGLADSERDFGRALLEIAARFNSEVAERLDGAGEKMRRGFLDWLAVRGQAARPARMPVVFKLADAAREGVLASAPVRLQADAGGTPVVFETEKDVRVVPGRLDVVVGVDADQDSFYLPPPGLSDLQPLESLPTEWRVKSFAAAGAKKIQLDPELGLVVGMLIEANGAQYTVREVDNGLVTIDRPLESELSNAVRIAKVTTFSPFESTAYNSQEHSLYLGDSDLLNVEAAATIEVVGASTLREGFTWQYWGKVDGKDEVGWQPLTVADPKIADAGIVLTKLKGAIEEYEIGGKKSRWLRAYTKIVDSSRDPFTADKLSFRINSGACGQNLPCPPSDPIASPLAEAMANTTPLVLDNIFLPLGREPRQFDAFYLASTEAFSKKGAQVQICFELADPTFESLAVVRQGQSADQVLAGVGKDRALHLFQFLPDGTVSRFLGRDALRPPLPGDSGAVPTQTTPQQLNPKCRPVIESVGNDFFIRVAAGGTIWTWHENESTPDGKLSGWKEFAALPESPNQPARIDDIVPIDLPNDPQVVLSNCRLWLHDGTEWLEKEPEDANTNVAVHLVALTPIWIDTNNTVEGLTPASMMVGVSQENQLYRVDKDGQCTLLPLTELVHAGTAPPGSTCNVDAIRPAAYQVGTTVTVVTANNSRDKLVFYEGDPDSMGAPLEGSIDLPAGDSIVSATVEFSFVNGSPQFSVLCQTPAGATYVASWQPTAPQNTVNETLFRSTLSNLGSLNGAPVTLPGYIVAPGARGDLFVASFRGFQRFVLAADAPEDGVVLPAIGNDFAANDVISVLDQNGDRTVPYMVTEVIKLAADAPEVLYAVTPTFGTVADNPELLGYRVSDPLAVLTGTIVGANLRLDANDLATVQDTFLLVEDGTDFAICKVVNLIPNVFPTPPDAVLDPPLPAGATGNYWTPEESVARVAPIIRLDAIEGNWNADILDQARLYFLPPVDPDVQRAEAFAVTPFTNHPEVIALQLPWVQAPTAGDFYVIDATLGEWQHSLADTSSNPELSWEYSNGTAWESLPLQEEGTLNLKTTGRVKFKVPNNLAAVDWAGKTNHWIRARLIGGDYGQEEVKVEIEKKSDTKSEQIVRRSTEGIHAPLVVKLHISYGICSETPPAFVLAQDSGTIRDQSDANRTGGAIVEAFVPIAVMLGRLSTAPTPPAAPQDCPPDCDCHTQTTTAPGTPAVVAPTSTAPAPRVGGRELFIGLDATPNEAPVNVLLLVDEHNHTDFAPLQIEALIANHFVPIVADDKTRALGESGLLEMSFAQPPTPSELFGKTRTWLRLIPKASAVGNWAPAIRGAYLNTVWASATETLTRELLGSSNGEPNFTVRLARPPVLHDTLELRVLEPLGEEEREALRQADKNIVLSDVEGLPGDWVWWKQVIDPGDEPAGERVYALDETIGEIRFGDGLHGRIPPIGRDSIVAFRYSRTEPDPTGGDKVPGNMITARTTLNLVSPVETVESVTAADQAAGGAPPESDERVLRFGFARLRHRNRAVTPSDLEDLALQSSPDIVQARAFLRRGYIRLVVVMRGKNPTPNAAQIRELRGLLLAQAPVALSAPGVLRIQGPRIRRLRIDLELRIETLDHAGELTTFVKEQLTNFFDTATGGLVKEGWALGVKPNEEDIALALIDAPHLESIGNVTLLESVGDTTVPGGLNSLKASDLVMLAVDPIRIQFETAEVMV